MNRQRFLMVMAMVLVACVGFAQKWKVGRIVSNDSYVTLRETPNEYSEMKERMSAGQTVLYKKCEKKGWYVIGSAKETTYGEILGYCSKKLVKSGGETTSRSEMYAGSLFGDDGSVNIYKGPGMKYRLVCSFPNGTTLLFSGHGEWLKAYNNGKLIGYVMSNCVQRQK